MYARIVTDVDCLGFNLTDHVTIVWQLHGTGIGMQVNYEAPTNHRDARPAGLTPAYARLVGDPLSVDGPED